MSPKRVTVDPTARLGRDVLLDADPGAGIVVEAACEIGDGTRVHARAGTVRIGRGTVLGERCAFVALAGITVGKRCLLGNGVVITDFEPVTDDVEAPVRLQGLRAEPVAVGDGARIGHGACLLAGANVPAGGEVGVHVVAT